MESRLKRVRWRCRRGSKELDLILSGFVTENFCALSTAEQTLFEQLLECADPQLSDWLCNGTQPDNQGMATIVERILSTARG